ncbi:hypothetical protein JTB14_014412 [Gonioctena quinquepunctata]|nr:hypothetical protein JTB14_014412 [Gonioctena quinquepunctata]
MSDFDDCTYKLEVPAMYSLGMVATTLDDFSGKDAERYFERLDSLSYYDLKNKFLKKFTPSKLPGESQWNLSRCFQRLDEEVSSFCTRLRIIGAKLLREDLSGATPEEEAGIRKKNKELLLNQFKIGLRKDLMKETGVLLLREENLDLEKAENLVKLQETTLLMMQGRMSNMKISTVETERVCYTCGKPGHLARECRRTKSTQPMEMHQKNTNLDPKILVEDSKGHQGHLHEIGDHLHGIGDHLHEIGDHRWQELEITKLGNKWGVRRWDHLQVLFQNGDRNRDFPHQVFPGMKRTKSAGCSSDQEQKWETDIVLEEDIIIPARTEALVNAKLSTKIEGELVVCEPVDIGNGYVHAANCLMVNSTKAWIRVVNVSQKEVKLMKKHKLAKAVSCETMEEIMVTTTDGWKN